MVVNPGSQRLSHCIKRKPASNLHHAVRMAPKIGRPLTHLVTINFAHTACADDQVSRVFEKIREVKFGPWIRRPPRGLRGRYGPPAYVWVIEGAGGCFTVHWLVHVPPTRLEDFKTRLPVWVNALAGPIRCAASAIDVRPAYNPKGAGRYMLKGMDKVYAKFYGIDFVDQGVVTGKRSGFSRSLGPSVRPSIGYKPQPFGIHYSAAAA